jgi:hypothetical protein
MSAETGIERGATIAFVDVDGVTWFGVALTDVQRSGRWPTVRVQIGARVAEVPARDVVVWPVACPARQARVEQCEGAPRVDVVAVTESACSDPRTTGRGQGRRPAPDAFDVGDAVVVTEPLRDRWRRLIKRGSRGVVTGRSGDGRCVVRFTTTRSALARPDQLVGYAPRAPLTAVRDDGGGAVDRGRIGFGRSDRAGYARWDGLR